MKKQELIKVYAFAGAMWSSFKIPTSELDAQIFDEAWYLTLAPYPLELVLTAMQQYAKESDFCNVAKIGAICEKYTAMKNGTYIDEEKTLENIRNAIDYTNCKENFDKLMPFEKELVGGAHMLARWAKEGNVDTVIMSNLRKTIRNKLETKKFEDTLIGIQRLNVAEHKFLQGESYGNNKHNAN